MQEIRTLCDRCKAPGARGFSYNIGRRLDAAGSSGDVDLAADLCDPCRIILLEAILLLLPRSAVIEEFLKKLSYVQEVGP